MVLAILFIAIIAIILCFLICQFPELEHQKDRIFVSFLCNFFVVILLGALVIAYHVSISAIEVYRGNTTLEILIKMVDQMVDQMEDQLIV